jgi:hypothetical protein
LVNWQLIAAGAALPIAGWCGLRWAVGASFKPGPALVIDAALPMTGFVLIFAASGKPIFAGTVILLAILAFAKADQLKRRTLLEPIVFADGYQTIDVVFRHPELNMLFSEKRHILCAVVIILGLFTGIYVVDAGVWPWTAWPGVAAAALVAAGGWVVACPLGDRLAALLLRCGATADPLRDAEILGPLAMQIAHVVIARAERPRRRAAVFAPAVSAMPARGFAAYAPVVVVQCESFFDTRPLHRGIPDDLLPVFDRCCASSIQYGRLSVPGFGANSVRTEFAVLSGLAEQALGFDRFNPYLCFARSPVRSLAWRMRAAGYRTICVHPFDPRFYRRDLVMRNLGFDAFLADNAFLGAARAGRYVADIALAERVAEIIWDEGPNVFVFAITMQNHGPWHERVATADLCRTLPKMPGGAAFVRFLQGIKDADAMLGVLTEALQTQGDRGLLAFYGDHLPGLHAAFRYLGHDDRRTDYLLWSPRAGDPTRLDLAAADLSHAIWDAWWFATGADPAAVTKSVQVLSPPH